MPVVVVLELTQTVREQPPELAVLEAAVTAISMVMVVMELQIQVVEAVVRADIQVRNTMAVQADQEL